MGKEVKSAMEIAMEKLEKIGSGTEDERLEWKYLPEGEKLAARYMKGEDDLSAEISRCEEKARKYLVKGASGIFIRNISLPKDDAVRKNNKIAMDGLKIIKSDKIALENLYSKVRHIFEHYGTQGEQQRNQVYQSFKAEFEAKFQQSLQEQMGTSLDSQINVENQPQFQEEWHKMLAQMELQYVRVLGDVKQELLALP